MHTSMTRFQTEYRKNALLLMDTFEDNAADMLRESINYWLNASVQFAKIMALVAQSWFNFSSMYWVTTKRLLSGSYNEQR